VDKDARPQRIRAFLRELRSQDAFITEFNERLWHSLIEKITVHSKDDISFTFKDGSVIVTIAARAAHFC
jgi:porphobilinogen deaminase